jgi:hypothetical protein
MKAIIRSGAWALCALPALAAVGCGGGTIPTPGRDLAAPPDFGVLPDLTPLPDLTVLPDLAMPPTAKFVGTWSYGAGATLDTDCPGQPPSTDISMNTFMVALKSGNTITFSAGNTLNCSFDFTVAGDTATIVPNQSCTITVNGFNAKVAPDSGSMVTADGMSGTLDAHAQVAGGLCTATIAAPAAKKM